MKKPVILSFLLLVLLSAGISQPATSLQGAFAMQNNEGDHAMIMQDNYFMHAVYNVGSKEFKYSEGGMYTVSGDSVIQHIEFSTRASELAGERRAYRLERNSSGITLSGKKTGYQSWSSIDEGNTALAGNWRITGRKEGDSIRQMQRGARKTLKILSGSRFQWAAINPETKEFFGTGGGTYTFTNGRYTELIEFFSRDSSRVGASLTFKGEIKNNQWHHSGNSSTGNPIYEIWSREQ
ncbi:membrane or secreted protein [Ilyomonas limi]|uniref:Membrane or secreted protein n=1 Tax=Ilyomonas limi TaxID=2575867 RepID=A0A4U3L8J6_9BACT|nr:membrane or secreted protein [Ilyomonas limi]TKK71621.1 membrane or secreted protein [Ilyomonas limi]